MEERGENMACVIIVSGQHRGGPCSLGGRTKDIGPLLFQALTTESCSNLSQYADQFARAALKVEAVRCYAGSRCRR